MLLFTEAHLEYNAGLVISIGSTGRPSPVEATSTAECLAEELADYRHQLLAMATPPRMPNGRFPRRVSIYPAHGGSYGELA